MLAGGQQATAHQDSEECRGERKEWQAIMFKRILVPLDGSERAEHALPIAARVARTPGCVVSLLRVVDIKQWYGPYVTPSDGLLPPGGWVPLLDTNEQREQAEAYLIGKAASPELVGIETNTLVREDTPARVILEEIEEQRADLVVLCSHGRTGVPRWALGSVAEHVARHAAVPVLVLRERSPEFEPGQPLRMLVPLDGSARARAAITPAIDLLVGLSAPAPAEVCLLMVVPRYVTEEHSMPYGLMLEGARTYLTGVAEEVRGEAEGRIPMTVTWSVVTATDIADGIIQVAENRETPSDVPGTEGSGPCDFIAMATHGHTGVARWALGSVVEHVLHGTQLPVLIVRPQDIAQQQRGMPAQTSAMTV